MRNRLITPIILGLSLIIAATVFGIYFYNSRSTSTTIKVVGATTQRYNADIIKWRITISRTVDPDKLKEGYTQLKGDLQSVQEVFQQEQIPAKEVTIQPINTEQIYGQSGIQSGYRVFQILTVISHDIPKVESLALNPELLVNQGIMLQSSNLEYYCSKLSEIKKTLLAKATQDAKRRAEAIAQSTGDRIDKISSARAGVFQITEPYSTEVADYGLYNTASRQKDITVTVNAEFTLH
jgi:hypothetical protein